MIRSQTSRCSITVWGKKKGKEKKIQLLSGFCSFEGRGFPLQTLLSALNTAFSKGIPEGRGQGWLLESDLIDDADRHVVFLLYGKLVKRDRLSHVYKIQGSYFLFFAKNGPLGLGKPSGLNRRDDINTNSSLSQYAPLYFQELLYLLRKMSHCDVLSQYFNYGSTGWHVTCCSYHL